MTCFLCGKEIGLLRRFVDQKYCCAEHRSEARLASARALRDDVDEEEEPWSVYAQARRKGKNGSGGGQTASVVALLAVGMLIAVALSLPNSGGGAQLVERRAESTQVGFWARAEQRIGETIRRQAPVTLRTDFRSGLNDLSDWATTTARASNGSRSSLADAFPTSGTLVRPGELRIWKRSLSLTNYEMEFQGAIEQKSMSWAFRATDPHNYYASKIVITKPGSQPNSGLVRYLMMNGKESDRVQLPLPLTLQAGTPYRVRVSVLDDHFITSVNGQVVSSWSDRRLRRGGVGFFADEGERAQVSWVSISERDSFLGRMLAHFSLIQLPIPIGD